MVEIAAAGRTTFVIAHRLSTIRSAINFVWNRRIVEARHPHDLLAHGALPASCTTSSTVREGSLINPAKFHAGAARSLAPPRGSAPRL